ncbi:hypothetical protein QTO34_016297 [Cnephaeus nilssonii]|uniref:Uncharacterized protein n=1 Tax=Cnephaeus nilssonii TaxID=3371016 RepID=A0AA40LTP2_CNENI|nr:hypothetical protein QTO34_016297 [Eptesicus nilssonii]
MMKGKRMPKSAVFSRSSSSRASFLHASLQDQASVAKQMAMTEHLPTMVRFVGESHNLREESDAEAEILTMKFQTMMTENCLHTRLFLCLKYVVGKIGAYYGVSVELGIIQEVVTDFDVIVIVVILKKVLSFTRAFWGKSPGADFDVFFAANEAPWENFAELNLESQLTSEGYSKETLSVPTVEHIIQELKDRFSEQHLRALQC